MHRIFSYTVVIVFFLLCSPVAGHADEQPRHPSEQLVLEFWRRVWSPPHDLSAVDTLTSTDVILTSAGKEIRGQAAFKDWIRQFQERLGEATLETLDIFTNADGSRVVSRWRCTGKNQGLFNFPADGRPVSFTGIAIWEIKENKLTHNWVERSAWELYQSLQD